MVNIYPSPLYLAWCFITTVFVLRCRKCPPQLKTSGTPLWSFSCFLVCPFLELMLTNLILGYFTPEHSPRRPLHDDMIYKVSSFRLPIFYFPLPFRWKLFKKLSTRSCFWASALIWIPIADISRFSIPLIVNHKLNIIILGACILSRTPWTEGPASLAARPLCCYFVVVTSTIINLPQWK